MTMQNELNELNAMAIKMQERVLQIRANLPISSKETHDWLRRVEQYAASMSDGLGYSESYMLKESPALLEVTSESK